MRQTKTNIASVADAQALHRVMSGTQIVVQQVTLPVITRSLEKREREYIPDGLRNAAESDPRLFSANASDFSARRLAVPAIGRAVTWHGTGYTISKVITEDAGAAKTAVLIYAYRTPPAGQSPSEKRQIGKWPSPPSI